jgi:hypothetical protein
MRLVIWSRAIESARRGLRSLGKPDGWTNRSCRWRGDARLVPEHTDAPARRSCLTAHRIEHRTLHWRLVNREYAMWLPRRWLNRRQQAKRTSDMTEGKEALGAAQLATGGVAQHHAQEGRPTDPVPCRPSSVEPSPDPGSTVLLGRPAKRYLAGVQTIA